MTELLFLVTIVFIAYTIYNALGNPAKSASASVQQPVVQEAKPAATAAVKETVAESKSEAAAKTEVIAPAPKQTAAVEKAANSLRDPKSGEIATIPANYRFAKRWIKDALVAEGLLDKVYKNSELDEAASAKVKQALDTLKAMEKYQA